MEGGVPCRKDCQPPERYRIDLHLASQGHKIAAPAVGGVHASRATRGFWASSRPGEGRVRVPAGARAQGRAPGAERSRGTVPARLRGGATGRETEMAGRGCHEAAGSAFFLFRLGQVHRPRPQNGESGYSLGELEGSGGGPVLRGSRARSCPRQARRRAGTGCFLPGAAGRRGDVAAESRKREVAPAGAGAGRR